MFHHAILNLPDSALTFLDTFRGVDWRANGFGAPPTVHVYCFSKAADPKQASPCCNRLLESLTAGSVHCFLPRLIGRGAGHQITIERFHLGEISWCVCVARGRGGLFVRAGSCCVFWARVTQPPFGERADCCESATIYHVPRSATAPKLRRGIFLISLSLSHFTRVSGFLDPRALKFWLSFRTHWTARTR